MLGVCVDTKVDPSNVLYYVKAMVDTFREHGNYENKARARTRFMQETLGKEGFIAEFHRYLSAAKAECDLTLDISAKAITKSANGTVEENYRIKEQKQSGLYAVHYHPVGGYLPVEKIEALYEAMSDMPETEIRVTPDGGLYVVNCTAEEAKCIYEITKGGAETDFEASVACVGGTRCSTGIADSQGLLSACLAEVKKENFASGVLPAIRISGCPSSCAAHQTAPLGFRGGMKRTAEGMKPTFAVFVGGSELQGKEKIADMGLTVLAEKIPSLLVAIGNAVSAEGTTFEKWIENHMDEMKSLIQKYAE
jgi:ferredoxin-nitrite reductase